MLVRNRGESNPSTSTAILDTANSRFGSTHPGLATPAFYPSVFQRGHLQFRDPSTGGGSGSPVGLRFPRAVRYGGRLAEFLTRRKTSSLGPVDVFRGRSPPWGERTWTETRFRQRAMVPD